MIFDFAIPLGRLRPNQDEEAVTDWLVEFYKCQYLEFESIGIGGRTRFDVEITEKLIRCTANRLDQLIKGKKTPENTCEPDRLLKLYGATIGLMEGESFVLREKALHSSNRSFIGNCSRRFHLKDLEPIQEEKVCNTMDYADGSPHDEPRYIDKYTTAYNSDVMVATLSHDN
tara:strand:- start:11 stop:526 length:516 start_codon:yes stop_codon:yes gene_type:complete